MHLLHEIVVAQGLQIEFATVLCRHGHKLPHMLLGDGIRADVVRLHAGESVRPFLPCLRIGGLALPAFLVLLRRLQRSQRPLQIRTDIAVRRFRRFFVDHATFPFKDLARAVTHASPIRPRAF
jgi:hypothetical protein